jgi:hypothetical protein
MVSPERRQKIIRQYILRGQPGLPFSDTNTGCFSRSKTNGAAEPEEKDYCQNVQGPPVSGEPPELIHG